jgi:hypothetical protein
MSFLRGPRAQLVQSTAPSTRSTTRTAPIDDQIAENGELRDDPPPSRAVPRVMPKVTPENIGLPHDGHWELNGAKQSRVCYEHDVEYLVKAKDRWMMPSDFPKPRAAAKALEALLESGAAHDRAADCTSTLLGHVSCVKAKRQYHGKDIYLVGWNHTWTPLSQFSHPELAQQSVDRNLKKLRLRQSNRIRGLSSEMERRKLEINNTMSRAAGNAWEPIAPVLANRRVKRGKGGQKSCTSTKGSAAVDGFQRMDAEVGDVIDLTGDD